MRVHVDEQRCEGHGRCYAIAAGVFEPTTSATATNGATAPSPPSSRTRPASRSPTAPSTPSTSSRSPDGRARSGGRLGHRLRPHRRRPGPPTRSRSGTSCASDLPGRPLRSLRRRVAADPPRRRRRAIAYDTEHFTSRSVIVNEGRPLAPAPRRHRPADLVGPAVPPRRPPAAAPGLLAPRPSTPLEPSTRGLLPRAARRRRRATTSSTPRSTTPSTSRCGSSPTCSGFPRRTPTCSATFVHARARRRRPAARAARRRLRSTLDAYLDRAGRGPHRPTPATTSSPTCSRPRSTASRSSPATSAAPSRCCSSPASTPRGAPSARRSGTSPAPRPTASGWSPSPSCCRSAIEELLRAYAPVTMARLVKRRLRVRTAAP